MPGDWQGRDQVARALESGEADLKQLVLDLWERVEELQQQVARLQQDAAQMPDPFEGNDDA
ncbi:hypothetical protein LPC08_22490 [Roseomonas sp. OT10]|uniref:hypothetical protein n=1 Tax=Roseomonas cutis TaxID=2897332 RepID=UPI001E610C00|nr:hypothetical protein [Roseomonas sp. OT10]UFN48743.1 hypothetical protein LPC08_22490 [Roseomonas sp. OT10]